MIVPSYRLAGKPVSLEKISVSTTLYAFKTALTFQAVLDKPHFLYNIPSSL
jgi:hypothetical protein